MMNIHVMVRLWVVLMILIIAAGCSAQKKTATVKILLPEGMPALAQTKIEYMRPVLEGKNYTIERVSGPNPLIAAMASSSHDVIYAPLTVGARLIEGGSRYRCAAMISWGNLFLVSGEPFERLADLDQRDLVGYGAGAPAKIVLETLLDLNQTEVRSRTYVNSVQAAMLELVLNPQKVILTAEPVLSTLQTQITPLYIKDLNALWEETFAYSIPQACVFVSNTLDEAWLDAYLHALEASMLWASEHPETLSEYAATLNYPFLENVIVSALPRSGLSFAMATDALPAIEHFLSIVIASTDGLLDALPRDDFYYRGRDYETP